MKKMNIEATGRIIGYMAVFWGFPSLPLSFSFPFLPFFLFQPSFSPSLPFPILLFPFFPFLPFRFSFPPLSRICSSLPFSVSFLPLSFLLLPLPFSFNRAMLCYAVLPRLGDAMLRFSSSFYDQQHQALHYSV